MTLHIMGPVIIFSLLFCSNHDLGNTPFGFDPFLGLRSAAGRDTDIGNASSKDIGYTFAFGFVVVLRGVEGFRWGRVM